MVTVTEAVELVTVLPLVSFSVPVTVPRLLPEMTVDGTALLTMCVGRLVGVPLMLTT